MKSKNVVAALMVCVLIMFAGQPIFAADKTTDLKGLRSITDNFRRVDPKTDPGTSKDSAEKTDSLTLPKKDKPKQRALEDLSLEEHQQIINQVIGAMTDPAVSALLDKKFDDYSAKLPLSEATRLTVQDTEVQLAILKILRPKLSQAPNYFSDERILAYVTLATEKIGNELKDSIDKDMLKQGINPLDAYIKTQRLTYEKMDDSQKIELLTVFTEKIARDDKLISLIVIKANDLGKNQHLSKKEAAMGAMLDAIVQKKITEKMTPILLAAPYSWTPEEIDYFIKAASMNLAEALAK